MRIWGKVTLQKFSKIARIYFCIAIKLIVGISQYSNYRYTLLLFKTNQQWPSACNTKAELQILTPFEERLPEMINMKDKSFCLI